MCKSLTLVEYITTRKQIESNGVEIDFFMYVFRSYCIRKAVLKRPSNFYVVRSENNKNVNCTRFQTVYKLFNSKNAYTFNVNLQ